MNTIVSQKAARYYFGWIATLTEDLLVLYSQFTTDLELEKHIIKLNRRNK